MMKNAFTSILQTAAWGKVLSVGLCVAVIGVMVATWQGGSHFGNDFSWANSSYAVEQAYDSTAFQVEEDSDSDNPIAQEEQAEAQLDDTSHSADGYSGNIFLKAVEGAGLFLTREMKKMFTKSVKTKLAALLMKDGLRDFKKLLDSNEVGGTALVGISKPVIKAHGSSDGYAIRNAIAQAQKFAASGIVESITENIAYMRLTPGKTGTEE